MNELFQFNEDFEIEVNPIVHTLVPFKKVLEKYKNKVDGITELSFIAFLCNPKSDFSDIRDEKHHQGIPWRESFAKRQLSSLRGRDSLPGWRKWGR